MGVKDPTKRDESVILNSGTAKSGNFDWWIQRSNNLSFSEFDCNRKSMGVIVQEPCRQNHLLVKGDVENML
jgi:magnesium-transporting ATPase (P-type)